MVATAQATTAKVIQLPERVKGYARFAKVICFDGKGNFIAAFAKMEQATGYASRAYNPLDDTQPREVYIYSIDSFPQEGELLTSYKIVAHYVDGEQVA